MSKENKSRRSFFVAAFFLIGISFLILPFLKPESAPIFLLMLGRFHPLVLHFPIVLIIITLLFEVLNKVGWIKTNEGVITVTLIASALFTFISVIAGFLLFASGEYSGQLMDQHFWAGTITGALIFITVSLFLLTRSSTRFYYPYIICLLVSNGAVGYTSHLGGSITHGQDYLTEYVPAIMNKFEVEEKPEGEMKVYGDMIALIFEAKCLSCHNEMRAKGDLLLTSYANLLKSGESGLPSLTAKIPEKSELYNRVVLSHDHKDHMPPEGKTPLNENEITLLKYWIESGAVEEMKVTEVKETAPMKPVVDKLQQELSRYRIKAGITRMKEKELRQQLDELAKKLSLNIIPDSTQDGNYYRVSMKFPPAPFTNNHLLELRPYGEAFSSISLVSSTIDDDALYHISQMPNVRELYLQKTAIEGPGLVYLKNMKNLEMINLSYTLVDDKSALDLLKVPNLKKAYLFQTQTSKQVADALQKYKSGLEVLLEEGPYF